MNTARHETAIAYRAVLLAAGLLVLGLLFRQLVTLMVAVLMTVLIAIPLSAFATWLERRGVPRVIGALIGLSDPDPGRRRPDRAADPAVR